ncbi:hypothetical protein HBH56_231270 [Parastagonospora nodorum]|uniref:Uncharacterized protein n=1 Tax=Phaeosphaeria nodorum (strain SN15 / ATCC MYA-4574 / FGSC 10173) TaxID=321614 RepID=A0A7U2F679_PHANO|nr:hypothetical protein HBH56_231270 [Parastagonospora nodorum]QRC99474.1 hypothetical protein JI435_413550 [Parastagonospora nodorum SN15]KAH3924470.1 hypothetical protein HBH54_193890 [Parastagonospora nodorum]KAH3960288.1 hypothetical protein HBH52_238290 [Parastagonospora nodorum]KAH4115080.1 hypothetical protein HBH47_187260 [Parastagonospora nodorum]
MLLLQYVLPKQLRSHCSMSSQKWYAVTCTTSGRGSAPLSYACASHSGSPIEPHRTSGHHC